MIGFKDAKKIRGDFAILSRKVNGRPLVYLDSAATSQKPKQVVEAISKFLTSSNANVHRGVHTLTTEATDLYEGARQKVADFVGAQKNEIIFVRNAYEAINLVAYSWGRINISKGDEIVLTIAEHHANFVPWQQLALENGAVLKIVPLRQAQGKLVDENGELDIDAFKGAITKKTKLVTFFHISNVLGTINDVHRLAGIVRRQSPKSKILIDGAQAVPHLPVDISRIGCDFYAFTGHKMLGPSGIGVLWGKKQILDLMPPFNFGGDMISRVRIDKSEWNEVPWKFEAGTPNIEGAIGLGAAVDYLSNLGMENVRRHEVELTSYALDKLSKVEGLAILGPLDPKKRCGVISFKLLVSGREIPPHDIASILDSVGVEIRSGFLCAEPLLEYLREGPVARASFYIYNTKDDVDRLIEGLLKVRKVFGKGSEYSEYSEGRKIRKSDKSENLTL